jgi:hypothetical protein
MGKQFGRYTNPSVRKEAFMTTLVQGERELLNHAVAERNAELLPLLSEVGHRPLTSDEREALRGALAEELTSSGLTADDEPTDYGRRIDDLIGRLAAF